METNTDTDMIDLKPVCDEVARLLDTVTDDQLAGPTPCPDYAVRDVLTHLLGLTVAFRDAARKDLGPTTDNTPGDVLPVLGADWRAVLARQLDELAVAWRSPDAWQGATRAGGVELPAAVAGVVALNEVLIHGWDVARGTGAGYEPDEATLQASRALLTPEDAIGPNKNSLFGAAVEVPADAPLLDHVIGLSGRRPDWKP